MAREPMKPEEAALALQQLDREMLEAAISEVHRELEVRDRCYTKWVEQGKLSRTDAKDRYSRQKYAGEILSLLLDTMPAPSA